MNNDALDELTNDWICQDLATNIKYLHLGMNGYSSHSSRALCSKMLGYEDQMSGQALVQWAEKILGERFSGEIQ